MITEHLQDQATLFALGELDEAERQRFAAEVRANAELREFLGSLQRTIEQVARAVPARTAPPSLKAKVLGLIEARATSSAAQSPLPSAAALSGLRFLPGAEATGWKPLPVPGAWVKLLSFEPERGYAVLLGKLEPGVRYPAHTNAGPEDFYILTGDLHVSDRALGPGDFHHADAGSLHGENYSVSGCTLLAVLTKDDPLVGFALA